MVVFSYLIVFAVENVLLEHRVFIELGASVVVVEKIVAEIAQLGTQLVQVSGAGQRLDARLQGLHLALQMPREPQVASHEGDAGRRDGQQERPGDVVASSLLVALDERRHVELLSAGRAHFAFVGLLHRHAAAGLLLLLLSRQVVVPHK